MFEQHKLPSQANDKMMGVKESWKKNLQFSKSDLSRHCTPLFQDPYSLHVLIAWLVQSQHTRAANVFASCNLVQGYTRSAQEVGELR